MRVDISHYSHSVIFFFIAFRQKSIKLFVYDAVETRLRMIIPYIDKWPQALATLTLSKAVPTALSNLLILVDDVCYYAGDRSVDVRMN